MSVEQTAREAELTVRNIGGIDETDVVFSPGVTILAGENATNRTSLLRGLMTVLGSDDVSMKADADTASVELELGEETYTRELTRKGATIRTDGEPYLDDPTLADLFAFLLESNEARRAVQNDEDLRDIIMRPVDTDAIQREIDRLVEKRQRLEGEIEEVDALKGRLPALEERRTALREEIEETKAELAATEEELEARNTDIEQTREEKEELETLLAELRSKRSELEDVRYDIETERESAESIRQEKHDLEAEIEDLPEAPVGEIEELESRLERRREQKRTLESEINGIQSVIRFNQEMLEDADGDLLGALDDSEAPVTDELLSEETVSCWTCGSEVPYEQIEATIEHLREYSQETLGEVNDIESQLEELNDEIRSLRRKQRRREELQDRRSELDAELERTQSAIERLTDRREELRADIEDLETEVEDQDDTAYEEVLDIHKQANQFEYELGRLEGDLEDVETEIADIEDRLDEESELKAEREAVDDEIEELRTKIDRIEQRAIEEFNDHMDTVLELLGYDNIERIWLDRVERDVREGRKKVTKTVFELHIVRQTESRKTYEDTLGHLSESEREVTGLVFALAGYLVHEVYETVPFMLLDSLEAIDADRIAALVDYVREYSDYLVVALLPEDAAAVEGHHRITDI